MKALPAAVCVALGLVGAQVLPLLAEGLPLTWTHTLNAQCSFDRRPWFGALPLGIRPHIRLRVGFLPPEVQEAVMACHVRRGLVNPQGYVNEVRRSWPSEAELTAWRAETWEP